MITMGLPMALALSARSELKHRRPVRRAPSAVTLRQDMRKLWTDHTVWTRDYIIAAVGDQPDAPAAAKP